MRGWVERIGCDMGVESIRYLKEVCDGQLVYDMIYHDVAIRRAEVFA